MAFPGIDVADLLSVTGDAVIRIGTDYRIIDADERALALVGIPRDRAIGRHLFSFLSRDEVVDPPPDWEDFYHRRIRRVPMEGRNDVMIRREDGTSFGAVIGGAWLEDGTGMIVFNRFEGRLDAERRIASLARQYQDLFHNLPIAVWENDMSDLAAWAESLPVDPPATATWLREHPDLIRERIRDIRVRAINRSAAAQIGSAAGESRSLVRQLERGIEQEGIGTFPEQIQAIREGVAYSVASGVAGRSDGSLFDAEIHQFIPTVDGRLDLTRVLVTILDTTESKRIQQELADAVSAREELISSVAHELRTPLTVVVGLMHSLAESQGTLSESEVAELLQIASAEADDLAYLIDDLLTYSRIGHDDHHVVPEHTDLRPLVEGLVERVATGSEVSIDGEASAFCDPRRARQIVRNLLTNARRYGGPHVEVRMRGGSSATLEVRDDGLGLPTSTADIFDAFTRAHDASSTPGAIGLGLTISRSLAEAMGGTLTHAREGDWTAFTLSLPAAEGD